MHTNAQGYFRHASTPFAASDAEALLAEARSSPFGVKTVAMRGARFLSTSTSPDACTTEGAICVTKGAIRTSESELVQFQSMKQMPFVHQSLKDTLVEVRVTFVCVCLERKII